MKKRSRIVRNPVNFFSIPHAWLRPVLAALVCAFVFSGCTVNVVQTSAATQPVTLQPVVQSPTGATLTPELPTETPVSAQATMNPNLPTVKVPVTWGSLNLTGRLVYLTAVQVNNSPVLSIMVLNLATGDLTTLFTASSLSWIYTFSVSPDHTQLVMSYSPPPAGNTPQPQALYLLPLDGSSGPALLFPVPAPEDTFFQPQWSPDGKYIYFSHFNYKSVPQSQHYPTYEVMRVAYPGGTPEKLADKAFWPNLSADGTRLVYITSNINDGTNAIVLADPDGKNPQPLKLSAQTVPNVIDAPIFSPDGNTLLFSVPVMSPAPTPTWFDRLFGIEVVSAHAVPSEWWQAQLTGGHVGAAVQMTHVQLPGLFASLSPDKRLFASFSTTGIFVMDLTGVELGMIVNDVGGVYGAVSWIP